MKSKPIVITIFFILVCNLLFAASPTISSFSPITGPVGTLVTINGTNLSTPTALNIGGQNAIVISNTGSILVAMVMPGSVTGTILITTTTGTAASISNFSVIATKFPSIQQGPKLVGTGIAQQYAHQGNAVALSADGNTAIVGGPSDNNGVGAAWIYTRSGGMWTQQGSKLVGSGYVGNSAQGNSVSLSADGNTAIVGGGFDNSKMGAVWVYTRSGGIWTQQGPKLIGTGSSGAALQGFSISLSADGNTLIEGGYFDNYEGAAWIFTRANGSWAQQGSKLVGADTTSFDAQGYSVALSADGNTAILGGAADIDNVRAAWVFTRSNNTWVQQGQKLVPSGTVKTGGTSQNSVVSLSADGNTAILGGSEDNNLLGAAWIFTRKAGIWAQQGSKLVAHSDDGQFGASVSLSADGNIALIGAPADSLTGAAWIFTRNGTTWTQAESKLVGTGFVDPKPESVQGYSVSLSADGNTGIVGSPFDGGSQGAAWVCIANFPTHQDSTILFTNTTAIATTVDWTNGDGASRAVFIAKASTGSAAPVNGATYTANASFGSGSEIGKTGWYCVYNGTGSTVNISGLLAGTTYRVMVVEYNGTSGYQQYLTTTATGNPNNVTTLSSNAYLSFMKLTGSGTALSPAFSFTNTTYTSNAPYTTTSVTVTPTTYVNTSTMKVNGVTLASGTTSRPIFLNVGANTINITVTAQDGKTKETYTITVTRTLSTNAYLSYMKIGGGGATLSPAFTFTNTTYTSSVPNTTASVTVTPTTYVSTSTQTVNGTALASGTTSPAIPLSVGSNTIDVVVTAQDGVTTLTYTITVTRAAGADNSLSQPLTVEQPLGSLKIADDGIMVHQAVSPNGDGINDFLTIENIGNFPENRLLIMNRDGLLIYEARGYDNSNRVFDGHSNKTGQMQLPGTYFYSLDYTVKGITKHKTGFLVLKY